MSTPPTYEVPTEMRDFAEKSVDQARKAFDSFIGAARRTAETVTGSTEATRTSVKDVSARGFEYAEQNVNAAFDLAQKLVRSKDVQEALQHQAEFVRSQFANIQAQAKEFGGLAQSALQQGAENAKSAVQQSTNEARQAFDQSTAAAKEAAAKATEKKPGA